MRRSQEEVDTHIEKTWDEFWVPMFKGLGLVIPGVDTFTLTQLNDFMEQLKKELTDYHDMIENTSKVFYDVTRGRISKPNTLAVHVIAEADEANDDNQRVYIKEWIESLDDDMTQEQLISSLKEHFNIIDGEED